MREIEKQAKCQPEHPICGKKKKFNYKKEEEKCGANGLWDSFVLSIN